MRKLLKPILFVLFCCLLQACSSDNPDFRFKYKLNQPKQIKYLPLELQEVSALTTVPETTHELACVQDEAGIIYYYDWLKSKLVKKKNFKVLDDFEALEIAENSTFVLASNGDFYKIPNDKSIYQKEKISISKNQDLEGMGYDARNNRLLIAPKSTDFPKLLKIFAYDLSTNTFKKNPVFTISIDAVFRFCKRNDVKLKISKKKFPFKPSAIAVHPYTGNIYILASVGKLLCVLSPNGLIMHIENLDKKIYPQPEGLTFLKSGDMVIASEGERGRLVLVEQEN